MDPWEAVKSLCGREPHTLVEEASRRAALLGLPVEYRVTRRIAYYKWGLRGAYFRVAVAAPVESGVYQVGLRMYDADFGVLAEVSRSGVRLTPWRLPDYLAVPGDLVTTHVSDVWKARLRAAAGGLEPAEPPSSVLELAGDLPPGGRWHYSRPTLDYVYGRHPVYPVWVSELTGSVSVSRLAAEALSRGQGSLL